MDKIIKPALLRAMAAAAAVLGLLNAPAAWGQSYPDRPIRFLVGFAAGGGGDIMARMVGQKLGEALGQQVIVENRPGASGNIAAEAVARAPANGYTVLLVAPPHALNSSLYRKMTYDPIKDFTAVIGFASVPLILNIHPSLPAKSVKELIALAKSRPGELTFSSGGSGTFEHLSGELLKQVAEINITHVPYKGSSASLTDLVSGQISMGFNSLPSVINYIKGQRLRPLANSDVKRSAVLPDVPTMAEAGFPGFEIVTWYGMVAPAGTPREVITRLNTEIARILDMPDTKERLASLGAQPMGGSPDQFDAYIKSESVKFGKIVRALNLQVD